MYSEVHIVVSMILSIDNEHIIQAIVGDAILLNYILEGDEFGENNLVKPEIWLLTRYMCLVSDDNLASVTLKVHLFLGLINISNQLGVTK